jgi:hypothetical protein
MVDSVDSERTVWYGQSEERLLIRLVDVLPSKASEFNYSFRSLWPIFGVATRVMADHNSGLTSRWDFSLLCRH